MRLASSEPDEPGSVTTGGHDMAKKNRTGIPRAAISVEEAAEALGIGRTYAFQLIKDGALETIKAGRRRLVPVKAVEAFLARMRKA